MGFGGFRGVYNGVEGWCGLNSLGSGSWLGDLGVGLGVRLVGLSWVGVGLGLGWGESVYIYIYMLTPPT